MKLYVKKICSLNPTKYKYVGLDEAQKKYNMWVDYCLTESPYYEEGEGIKTFDEWLKTEI